ncbi:MULTISPECIES: arsenite efflux transporter metallochaperone ArsD [unclassified Dehalobacter]|jgi:Arsenical resistance operon trans-acting repressor ArsD.|uniref:arsenite efflux transporter metallochaperone ArsD n=1 Tax=unclassified Dehalobacter TaxID=2635733 RepID=UPI00028B4668|nr:MULTISPECIES: arsenite efflux transporter metallochaperone ArsD [unclassified Dehalobacter]AFV01162.1 Arsenical resistance operon trans-acting repressor ArsD [Dehalobacter sp. DCA]AFV04205.1 Arsenical resistance operon trans-acting repressor ArsD [Dehalobacter sp. CF]
MKGMQIYEPAMCCPTGLCGVSVDPELLRVSTVLDSLKKNGIEVQRFNLSSSPQEFVNNKSVNKFITEKGVDELPVTVLDDEIVITGRYPTNEEFAKLLNVPSSFLGEQPKTLKLKVKSKSGDCGCSGDNCC